MFSFFSSAHLAKAKESLIKRFPLPTLVTIVLAIYCWYIIAVDINQESRIFTMISTLILVFFLLVGTRLWRENQRLSVQEWLWYTLPFLYGGLYYWYFYQGNIDDIEHIVFFGLHMVGFVAFLFFVPYLFHQKALQDDTIEYQNYFSRITWTILMSMIVGGALLVLGFIAISAVYTLFEVQ